MTFNNASTSQCSESDIRFLAYISCQSLRLTLPKELIFKSLLAQACCNFLEDGDKPGDILKAHYNFEELWGSCVIMNSKFNKDSTPISILARMAAGIFLCWTILDAAESDLNEMKPIIKIYEAYAAAISTATAPRMTRAMIEGQNKVIQAFQERCTVLRMNHLWRNGSTLRYIMGITGSWE